MLKAPDSAAYPTQATSSVMAPVHLAKRNSSSSIVTMQAFVVTRHSSEHDQGCCGPCWRCSSALSRSWSWQPKPQNKASRAAALPRQASCARYWPASCWRKVCYLPWAVMHCDKA